MPVQVPTAPITVLPATPRAAARLSAVSLAVIGAFGFVLPVMRLVDFAGGRVNASAADLLVLPVLFLVRGRLLKTGALGYWLFGLWMINLVSWTLSVSMLTLTVLQRECMKLAFCYIYALAGFAIGRELRSRDALVKGILWSAIPLAAYGIVAFFTRRPDWYFDSSRVAGTFGDANAFGIYLGMLLPLVGSAGPGWMIMPLFIGAGVVSFSRTGLAAIGSSLALNWLHLGVKRYLLVAAGCIAVFLAVYTIAINTTTVGKRLANYHSSLEERQSLWGRAAEVTARHPLFGIGKGNWESVSGSHTLPHNTFLSLTADGGLIGLAVFLIPVAVWVGRGLRRPAARAWAIAVFAGMVGGLAVSLDNFRPFWLAVGMLAAVLSATGSYQGTAAAARAGIHSPRNRHWR
jgi:O-antigen ligase